MSQHFDICPRFYIMKCRNCKRKIHQILPVIYHKGFRTEVGHETDFSNIVKNTYVRSILCYSNSLGKE